MSFVNVPADDHAVVVKHEEPAVEPVIVNASFQMFFQDSETDVSHDAEVAENAEQKDREGSKMDAPNTVNLQEFEQLRK